jgi:hypothetical protein
MMVATYAADSAFRVLGIDPLFDASPYVSASNWRQYDVTLDDERFIMYGIPGAEASRLIMVQNWFTELEERMRTP